MSNPRRPFPGLKPPLINPSTPKLSTLSDFASLFLELFHWFEFSLSSVIGQSEPPSKKFWFEPAKVYEKSCAPFLTVTYHVCPSVWQNHWKVIPKSNIIPQVSISGQCFHVVFVCGFEKLKIFAASLELGSPKVFEAKATFLPWVAAYFGPPLTMWWGRKFFGCVTWFHCSPVNACQRMKERVASGAADNT